MTAAGDPGPAAPPESVDSGADADRPPHCVRCGAVTREQLVESRPRPVCTSCGTVAYVDPKLAVAVVIVRAGQVLLGRRGPGTREPGKWSFPAGFVERGERVEAAAIREAREETGLDVSLGPLVGLFSDEGDPVVLAVYAATSAGEPAAGDDLTEVGWFPLADLPELAFPRDQSILAAWLDGETATQRAGESARAGRKPPVER